MPEWFDTAITADEDGAPTSSIHLYEPFGQAAPSATFGTNSNPSNATDQPMGWAANPTRKVAGAFTTLIINSSDYTGLATVIARWTASGGWCIQSCGNVAKHIQPAASVTHQQLNAYRGPIRVTVNVYRPSARPSAPAAPTKTRTTVPQLQRIELGPVSPKLRTETPYRASGGGGSWVSKVIPPAGYSFKGAAMSVLTGCAVTGGAFVVAGGFAAPFTGGFSVPVAALAGCKVGAGGAAIDYLLTGDDEWGDASVTGDVSEYLRGSLY